MIFLMMLFCHVLDDYVLQGILANLKQKSFWEKNAPDEMYRYDFIVALIMHSLSWTFMVQLPLAIAYHFNPPGMYYFLFPINMLVHGVTDHLKANAHKINLIADQTIHVMQIIVTYLLTII